jgi:hypothetical protein
MCWTDAHLEWLVDTGINLQTADGVNVPIFEFRHDESNDTILSEWATHFRNHYCSDTEIDEFREGEELSRYDYLIQIKFPDSQHFPGPIVRSGDWGEILVADYVEYRLGYTVPRIRYCWKEIRNESPKGIDVLGFRMHEEEPSRDDTLITYEVKCALSDTSRNKRTLRNAIADSEKDFGIRKAESLNAMYQRLRVMNCPDDQMLVRRFQKRNSHPYKEISGAAAIHSASNFNNRVVQAADTSNHPNNGNLDLLVIQGDSLMQLCHALYRRAADEA